MILLPMEIIYKIISYTRETHPVAKIIKNRPIDYQKLKHKFIEKIFNPSMYPDSEEKLFNKMYKLMKPYFIDDNTPYYWIIKHPDYHPTNEKRLDPNKMKEKPTHSFLKFYK